MRRPVRLRLPLLGGVGALAVVLAGCGTTTVSPGASALPAGLPPAQALPGPGGTWATLAMGHFDDPLNTFGELFFRPGSASADGGGWTLTTPPGVASNGGIMVAADGAGGLTAGFGVSLDLRFSPLADTTDAGATWSGGILPVALAAVPDALAASGPSQRLALAAAPPVGTGTVLASAGDLSTWSRLTSTAAVAAAAGPGCALHRLSAVAVSAAGDDLVAGDCAGGGRAAIFRIGADGRPSTPVAIGPSLRAPTSGPVRVDRMVATATGVAVLVSTGSGGSGAPGRVYLASTSDGGATWTVSAPYVTGRAVTSAAVTPSGGFAVLFGGTAAAVAEPGAPGAPWRTVATPPVGTVVLAALPDGSIEALAPTDVQVDVHLLGPSGWRRVQQLAVPVPFGSTSAGGGGTN